MSVIVIALGGNAILPPDATEIEAQRKNIRETIRRLRPIRESGYEIVLGHGNGPQVGTLMLENEKAGVQDAPMDVLGAESQGQIGYHIQQAWYNEFDEPAITVITQTQVDPDDPAFENPTKPVGPYYTEEEAAEKPFPTQDVSSGDEESKYRRIVPSPEPMSIIEADPIAEAIEAGRPVISTGGGGVPVMKGDDGDLAGQAAVIDKDLACKELATEVDADELMLLTDVDAAYVNFGTEDEKELRDVTVEELDEYLEAGEFGVGSMGPKVEAICRFVESGGDRGIITSLDKAEEALEGNAGTQVTQVK